MSLRTVYLWFYCLPIWKAAAVVLLGTAVFLALKARFDRHWQWKIGVSALLCACIGIILYSTIAGRTEEGAGQLILSPFQSYWTVFGGGERELLRSNFMNVVLFYPAGLVLASALPEKWHGWVKMVLIFVLFTGLSVGIEWMQYHQALGQAETDDVIHNSLGALLGAAAANVRMKLNIKA